MTYRIFRAGNSKKFVETDSPKLIKSILKEETKNGYNMIVKEKHGGRWYKVNPDTITN